MQKLIDKTILISTALILTFILNDNILFILLPLLSIIILASIDLLIEKQFIKFIPLSIYLAVCFFYIQFIIFLPVLFYPFNYKERRTLFCLLGFIPFIFSFNVNFLLAFIIVGSLAFTLNIKTYQIVYNKTRYFNLFETAKEEEIKQKKSFEELKDNQYYKMNMIKLEERNSIAAEIHDNVGHLLSSSIILTGALISTTKEEQTKKSLSVLQESLKTAMTNIRESVHSIHHDIYDLKGEIVKLINEFTFCETELKYNINSFIENIKCRHIISIIKECLTNIIKHSNAKKVNIILNELPGLFQLIIHDDGTNVKTFDKNLGLKSIEERVKKLNGVLNISTQNGFKIFISFTKE